MSEQENWTLQVSYRTRMGAMINIRATSAEDLADQIKTIRDMAPDILEAEAELFGGGNIANVTQQLGATPIAQAPSFVPQAPPQQYGQQSQPGNAPMCKHNLPAKYVPGGISKSTQRPYRAFWACPLDREQQCDFRSNG